MESSASWENPVFLQLYFDQVRLSWLQAQVHPDCQEKGITVWRWLVTRENDIPGSSTPRASRPVHLVHYGIHVDVSMGSKVRLMDCPVQIIHPSPSLPLSEGKLQWRSGSVLQGLSLGSLLCRLWIQWFHKQIIGSSFHKCLDSCLSDWLCLEAPQLLSWCMPVQEAMFVHDWADTVTKLFDSLRKRWTASVQWLMHLQSFGSMRRSRSLWF